MILLNEDGTQAGYYDVINWWLEHYKGMEITYMKILKLCIQ